MNFEIRKSSKLYYEIFNFYLQGTEIILDRYGMFKRETTRHGWKKTHGYNRIFSRDSTIKEENVPLTQEIINEAIEIVKNEIKFRK